MSCIYSGRYGSNVQRIRDRQTSLSRYISAAKHHAAISVLPFFLSFSLLWTFTAEIHMRDKLRAKSALITVSCVQSFDLLAQPPVVIHDNLRSSAPNAARYRHDEESAVLNSTLAGIENPWRGPSRGPPLDTRLVEEIGHDWMEIVMAISSGNQWAALRPSR